MDRSSDPPHKPCGSSRPSFWKAHRRGHLQFDNILDDRTEVPVFLLETILIFSKEQLEIVKKQPIKNLVFRMTLALDPCLAGRMIHEVG